MKKKLALITGLLLLIFIFGYFFLFTSQFSLIFADVQIVPGVVELVLNSDAVPSASGGGGATFCSIAKKGCEDYVNMIPKSGQKLTEKQEECLSSGCLVWGIPERESYTLNLTNTQASSLANDYKPKSFLVKNIKCKFEKDRAYCQGLSLYPFAPGQATIEVEQTGPKQIQIVRGYLGRVPMPSIFVRRLERYINNNLKYDFNYAKLDYLRMEDGRVIIQAKIPKVLIKEIKINQ